MKKVLLDLLDWIYKKRCYFCKSSRECISMCSKCYNELEFLPSQVNREILGVKVYAAGLYQKNMQKMIRGVKYHNQKDLANYQAKFMFEYWKKLDIKKKFQVVPVPMFKKNEKKRKYNHMNLVVEEFCKLSGYEANFNLIKRVKDTKPQYKLKRLERMQNLKDAFVVDKTKSLDCEVLILDDILTTGSTFESMILELNKNGCYNIICMSTSTVS